MTHTTTANRTVVITGGTRGLGAQTARRFCELGNNVWILARTAPAETSPPGLRFLAADVRDTSSLQAAAKSIASETGAIDVWINNAGYGRLLDFHGPEHDQWNDIFNVNFWGVVNGSRAALETLRKPGGVIINIASVAAIMAPRRHSAYAVSKAAVIALTRSLAVDYAAEGIRVNAIAPGPLDTEGFRSAGGDPAKRAQTIPTRQMVQPDEIADACLYLSGPSCSLTGHTLVIDGACSAAGCYV